VDKAPIAERDPDVGDPGGVGVGEEDQIARADVRRCNCCAETDLCLGGARQRLPGHCIKRITGNYKVFLKVS
jgi:hypothetical protein